MDSGSSSHNGTGDHTANLPRSRSGTGSTSGGRSRAGSTTDGHRHHRLNKRHSLIRASDFGRYLRKVMMLIDLSYLRLVLSKQEWTVMTLCCACASQLISCVNR